MLVNIKITVTSTGYCKVALTNTPDRSIENRASRVF